METIEKRLERPEMLGRPYRANRWLAVLLVIALAALAGLGVWLLVDNFVRSDLEALVDRFQEASNTDPAAVASMFTENGVLSEPNGEFVGRTEIEARQRVLLSYGFETEATGDLIEFGSTAAQPTRVSVTNDVRYEGISVYEFEGDLIKRFYFIGSETTGG